jgi:hypothetical protein
VEHTQGQLPPQNVSLSGTPAPSPGQSPSAGQSETTPSSDFGGAEPGELDPAEFDPGVLVRKSVQDIWNRRDVGAIRHYYTEEVAVHGTDGAFLQGLGEVEAAVLARLAPFPDGTLYIDDLFWSEINNREYNVALRWTFKGTHRRNGVYGKPTYIQVGVTGLTHQLIRNRKIVEEWNHYGEFDIIKQFHSKRYQALRYEEEQHLRAQEAQGLRESGERPGDVPERDDG